MAPEQWLSEAEQQMWRRYLDASRLLHQTMDRQLVRDSAITLADFEVLVMLSEAPDRRLRMSELASGACTTRGGATRTVQRLVAAGWVRRVKCEDDKRGSMAELTEGGAKKLAQVAPGHVSAVRENFIDLLSPRDVDRLTYLYGEMRDHLRANSGSGDAP
ncbi:MarR family winged helix-turn-helix transcriptional regulator [Mycolicibacterium porcinum]|uniref:MarR family winged helix-turn-helix transcriptional regulator n=1 Tax=Mycolicibacterium porcinum TaxID=39693 RepID=UPI00080B5CDA|nr:MarR family transcriptional regulator [Mycolicibacterium porcinum]MBX8688529.1 MarR family transcriptional regulator [Mycobacterium sp. 20091114027_K0903767]OCB48364.1 MarR family transcriptional regulator [Mycolicibacterium vulneris]TVX96349.1 MarR family transcriptional regulator [Mycolicibacterium porcinum]